MKDIQLLSVLRNIHLCDCEYIGNHIYYIRKPVTTKYYNPYIDKEGFSRSDEEFLILASHGIKQGIIHNCDNRDLHWYVFKEWRNQGVLSNALRTNIIKRIWPNIKTVSICYNWDDNKDEKRKMTEHLAALAGLGIAVETTSWLSPL